MRGDFSRILMFHSFVIKVTVADDALTQRPEAATDPPPCGHEVWPIRFLNSTIQEWLVTKEAVAA